MFNPMAIYYERLADVVTFARLLNSSNPVFPVCVGKYADRENYNILPLDSAIKRGAWVVWQPGDSEYQTEMENPDISRDMRLIHKSIRIREEIHQLCQAGAVVMIVG